MEIKPCPFCGSPGVLEVGERYWWVYCSRINACGAETGLTKGKATAIKRWNRRAADKPSAKGQD
jgi:Lar family restriction alleviation protein